MKLSIYALAAACVMTATQAMAWDSYQGGENWGVGADGGDRAQTHATWAQNAIRLKNGDNLTSSTIYSIGTQVTVNVNGNNNTVNGNNLNGENTNSPVSTDGQISGRDSGDFNPFDN